MCELLLKESKTMSMVAMIYVITLYVERSLKP
jgi:hypothetical protein